MQNQSFYTITIDGKFMNSNFMKDYNKNIVEAIKFTFKEDAIEYLNSLRKDKNFKVVKVDCTFSEINI